MSYSKSKNREAKRRTRLYNASLTRQPTLESFGFHICGKIGGSPAHAKLASDTLDSQISTCYPFVKWAGGKRQIVSQLYALAPSEFNVYFEPFLGGGALFFNMKLDKNDQFNACLSDINSELINSYIVVKNDMEKLIKLLTQHEVGYNQDPEEYYYKLRNDFNLRSCSDMIERAAQFITLNKTGYNGLYRVNRKGYFNVPWGKYINPTICDINNLRNVSHVLHNCEVTIKASDYKEMLLENAKEGDFIYLDQTVR
jgi:DNA adenine methylase